MVVCVDLLETEFKQSSSDVLITYFYIWQPGILSFGVCLFEFKLFSLTSFSHFGREVGLLFVRFLLVLPLLPHCNADEEVGPNPLRDKNMFPQTSNKTQTLNVLRSC